MGTLIGIAAAFAVLIYMGTGQYEAVVWYLVGLVVAAVCVDRITLNGSQSDE